MKFFSKKSKCKKNSVGKKVLIVSGMMLALFMSAPMVNSPVVNNMTGTIEAHAAELPYSSRWETQSDGSWKYKMDAGGYATSAWVQDEVDGNWYLLSESGVMRSGIFESYGKYYLLSEIHDGHFGHLVKNGSVYNGVTISASTNADDEGALSQSTISALQGLGYSFGSAPSVTGTQHVSGGHVTSGGSNSSQQQSSSEDGNWDWDSTRIAIDNPTNSVNGWDPEQAAADANFLRDRNGQ